MDAVSTSRSSDSCGGNAQCSVVPRNLAFILDAPLSPFLSPHIKSRAALVGSPFRIHPGSNPPPPPPLHPMESQPESPLSEGLQVTFCGFLPSVLASCQSSHWRALNGVTRIVHSPAWNSPMAASAFRNRSRSFLCSRPWVLPELLSPKPCPAHYASTEWLPCRSSDLGLACL